MCSCNLCDIGMSSDVFEPSDQPFAIGIKIMIKNSQDILWRKQACPLHTDMRELPEKLKPNQGEDEHKHQTKSWRSSAELIKKRKEQEYYDIDQ